MKKEKIVFDTNALMPAFIASHPMHSRCHAWLDRALSGEFEWGVPTHCLAELYAGMTAIPSSPRVDASAALRIIDDNILGRAKLIPLDESDYQRALEKCVLAGALSGAIYDALVVVAAEKFHASRIITSNHRDFIRFLAKKPEMICIP